MTYERCERCWRKVPGVQCGTVHGAPVELCARCRWFYDTRFQPDHGVNRQRARAVAEARTANTVRRALEEAVANITVS